MTYIKDVLLIILVIICGYLFITHNSGINYKKDKEKLEMTIKFLENKEDSINKINIVLENQYVLLQKENIIDSIISDSLRSEYNILLSNAKQNKKKSKYWLSKYSLINKKIQTFDLNKNYKKGDELINSLSKKINEK